MGISELEPSGLPQGQPPSGYQSKLNLGGSAWTAGGQPALTAAPPQTTAPGAVGREAARPRLKDASGRESQSLAAHLLAPGVGRGRAKSRQCPSGPLLATLQSRRLRGAEAAEGARGPFTLSKRVGRGGVRGTPLGRWLHRGWQVVNGASRLGCCRGQSRQAAGAAGPPQGHRCVCSQPPARLGGAPTPVPGGAPALPGAPPGTYAPCSRPCVWLTLSSLR